LSSLRGPMDMSEYLLSRYYHMIIIYDGIPALIAVWWSFYENCLSASLLIDIYDLYILVCLRLLC
jgi:hypothetical protein